MKKLVITALIVLAAGAVLVWAFQSFDLVGMFRRMHGLK